MTERGVAGGHDLALNPFKLRYVTGGGEDSHALRRQSCCDRAVEALAGAGDERRLSPKFQVHIIHSRSEDLE
ncbi:hypothetical protein OQ496_13070 [Acetobacter suratthaniensis]|uniref:Uncharacterized protein n=1 Tax=Acetobacter suratthaniensis TaxID=1502841 RepID=A0ABS3LPN7_9PROT|nr:hypothetical protein [Acetobacter suratthaniensis]MBO1329333.1 hypothetical protein [Acetobacter suratthaniensis]MCX2567385.1 hypothetical protein [Acetobacter suratthaniensis]